MKSRHGAAPTREALTAIGHSQHRLFPSTASISQLRDAANDPKDGPKIVIGADGRAARDVDEVVDGLKYRANAEPSA